MRASACVCPRVCVQVCDLLQFVNINKHPLSLCYKIKINNKQYHKHTGYFGSVKSVKMTELLEKNPEKLFKLATRGMLPKTKLGAKMLKKLKVYVGAEHPHTAQINKGA